MKQQFKKMKQGGINRSLIIWSILAPCCAPDTARLYLARIQYYSYLHLLLLMPAYYCYWTFLLPSFRNGSLMFMIQLLSALFSLIVLKDSIRVFDLIIMINLAGGTGESRQGSLWCFIEIQIHPTCPSLASWPSQHTHDLWH